MLFAIGCGRVVPDSGGGMIKPPPARPISAQDIVLAPGYAIEPVAAGMTFPTGVTFDDAGRVYLIESGYAYGEVFLAPKLLRVDSNGSLTTIATGEKNALFGQNGGGNLA